MTDIKRPVYDKFMHYINSRGYNESHVLSATDTDDPADKQWGCTGGEFLHMLGDVTKESNIKHMNGWVAHLKDGRSVEIINNEFQISKGKPDMSKNKQSLLSIDPSFPDLGVQPLDLQKLSNDFVNEIFSTGVKGDEVVKPLMMNMVKSAYTAGINRGVILSGDHGYEKVMKAMELFISSLSQETKDLQEKGTT